MRAILSALAVLTIAATPARAELAGRWLTGPGESGGRAIVEIYQCAGVYCGRIVDLVGAGSRERIGVELIRGLRRESVATPAKGEIFSPRRGQWFGASVREIDADTIEVSGCGLGGLVCRKQDWRRVD